MPLAFFTSAVPAKGAAPSADASLDVALDAWGTCRRDPHKPGQTEPHTWRGAACEDLDCGEDSFLVLPRLLAIADGVGGWRRSGVDSSVFSNSLLRHCKTLVQDMREYDPVTLIKGAFSAIVTSKEVLAGGSTVCLAVLWPRRTLRTANLGDSGMLVVRDGKRVFQTKEQLWQFNMPYQLAVAPVEWQAVSNRPEDSSVADFDLLVGDVVVMGSDGLLDNLFPDQIVALVTKCKAEACSSQKMAEALREAAFQASLMKKGPSPFQMAALQNRLWHEGGKPDDITVIVAQVVPAAPPCKL